MCKFHFQTKSTVAQPRPSDNAVKDEDASKDLIGLLHGHEGNGFCQMTGDAPLGSEPAAADPFTLRPRRVHEAGGRGRRAFALFQAARHPGSLVWILPSHVPEMPLLRGFPRCVGERLLLIRPVGEVDLLWCIEQALRAAPISFVIAEPEKPISLTAGRRFQLAAEDGRTTGLMLIREAAGSNAAETRWKCEPMASPAEDSTLHKWELKKNKQGTYGSWILNWNGATTAVDMVSPVGERDSTAETSR